MRYIDKILTLPPDNADNALFLGTALHTGLEKGVKEAINQYYMSYPVITDLHINEAMKLEYLLPKAAAMIPPGENEVKVENEHFIGYLDRLVPVTGFHDSEVPNVYDLYDFKYSNNVSHYKDSPQLHLYKYFWEKENPGKKIRNMYFLFVPKVNIKQKKTEDLFQFRQRIQSELNKVEPQLVQIEFNLEKVLDFLFGIKCILETAEFPKQPNWLCNYCEYQEFCQKGIDYMLLPKNQRRSIGGTTRRKIWIYGAAFSGKTTMLDKAPSPLNLNTDGNIQFVTMPYVAIKDEVTVTGRMTNRKFAWEVFKDVIAELEKKQNDFKTIIIDLLEDTREMCRVFKYDEMKIQHESDSGYGKGWDIIKTEYLSTMRRFFNLDYENLVVISHEDVSKDINKKNGQNITRIAPNIQDAIANKIAGMVDIVARVVVEDDDSRTLNFKSNEVVFGGGRLKGITSTSIPLEWDALMNVYEEANKAAEDTDFKPVEKKSDKAESGRKGRSAKKAAPELEKSTDDENMSSNSSTETVQEPVKEEKPRTRKSRNAEPSESEESMNNSPDGIEEKPKTRRSRTSDVVITRDAEGRAKVTPAPDAEPVKEEPKTRTRKRRETTQDGFVNIPDGIDEELPFN
nr:AAA family ATPase [uncultured Anaerocolumna sp.]